MEKKVLSPTAFFHDQKDIEIPRPRLPLSLFYIASGLSYIISKGGRPEQFKKYLEDPETARAAENLLNSYEVNPDSKLFSQIDSNERVLRRLMSKYGGSGSE